MNDKVTAAKTALRAMAGLNPLVRDPFDLSTGGDGPLSGMPIVVKANIAIDELPQCGASPALEDNIAQNSAPVVQRLLDAGAVIVGQANMHELAFGITSYNAYHGAVGNPANPAHMAGGSSGGTAAAVASGAVSLGLASDTGGSGRLPAAMCGCVGFRPTQGRYPSDGILTLSSSFDTVTPMARDVAGLTLIDAVMAGVAPRKRDPHKPLRLGVVEDAFWQGVDAAMAQACRDKLNTLEDAGVHLVPLSAPDLMARCADISMGIVLYETQIYWDAFLASRDTTMIAFADQIASPDVASIFGHVASGAAPSDADYAQMSGPKRRAICKIVTDLLADVDGLIMPTLATTAPLIDQTETCRINGEEVDLFNALTARALVASITGHPEISLPAGQLGGLPIGLGILGTHGQDDELLAVAAQIEPLLAATN
ncbi:amidase [Jannaschia sp. CCS1]|uniref:amidase n=1 Tax=Jannaschia sp. (strain CCS1) TaxID=290400 RepID=UPI000053D393|nr:amidase [Jannaschia sp. CCS1]ABD56894.1 Amidase [Jannaschia sp. CCS1]